MLVDGQPCRNPGTVGAHIRKGWLYELGKVFGRSGGTPVVPCCTTCHNKRGSKCSVQRCLCVVDHDVPVDLLRSEP